ncbi:MAG: hypothetical protein WAW96_02775 [Alphaproteobacteria bacterium]
MFDHGRVGDCKRLIYALKLRANRARSGITVPEVPHMEREDLACFARFLGSSKVLLEYGSGGSSIQACKEDRHVISVDSDKRFLTAVQETIQQRALPGTFVPLHVDIGIVGLWGVPVFQSPNKRRLQMWSRYWQAPWDYAETIGVQPDLVLIDGRFRVACALESIHRAKERNLVILVDDYQDRPEYAAIERFAHIIERAGRLVAFRPTEHMISQCATELPIYAGDWH